MHIAPSDALSPVERAPVLRLLGAAASPLAAALRAEPALAQRLALAPPRDVHAIAAFLGSTAAACLSATERAARLATRHPRDLLAEALPGCDRRLYRVLERASFPGWPFDAYRQLDDLLRAGLPQVTGGHRVLTPGRVAGLHDCLGEAPAQAAWLVPFEDAEDRAALRALLAFLDAAGLLQSRDLPTGADDIAVSRAVLRGLSRAAAPAAPFAVPAGWRPLRTGREVFAVGRRLGNCLRGDRPGMVEPLLGLLAGHRVLLHHAGAEVVASLVAEPGGLWSLGTIRGRRNAPAPDGLVQDLLAALQSGGLRVLPVSLEEALERALSPLHHRALGMRLPSAAASDEEDDIFG